MSYLFIPQPRSTAPNMPFPMNEAVRGKVLHYPGGVVPAVQVGSLDVDPQRGFSDDCPMELPVRDAYAIVPELARNRTLAAFWALSMEQHPASAEYFGSEWNGGPGSPITHIPDLDQRWPRHLVAGEPSTWLLRGLPHVRAYHIHIVKGSQPDMHPYGPFYHDQAETITTGLIEFFWVRGVLVLIVGGLALDYCVKVVVLQALRAGFTVILNLGATRPVDPKTGAEALVEMKRVAEESPGEFVVINSADELSLEEPQQTIVPE